MPRTLRFVLVVLLLVGLGIGGWFAYQHFNGQPGDSHQPGSPNSPAGSPTGKLVVLLVFDQMRGDYLERWADGFGTDGFERIKREGIWFSDCHLPYACSSTGPGHASIVTGVPPSVHGIIENGWNERGIGLVYCVQPTRAYDLVPAIPANLGKPGRGSEIGFGPDRLLAETVGDRLQAATGGKGRVVSLSLKDRTAVLMGGKKPDAAYCFDTRDGKFHTGANYRDRPHDWVEELNASGAANAWFGKKWEPYRTDLDYDKLAGPDAGVNEAYGYAGQGRLFPHPFSAKSPAPDKDYYATVECSPAGSDLLLDLAKKAIIGEKLGAGEAADLLCVSFSSNDIIGHQWGPDSWEALDITLRSDRLVAGLLKFLEDRLGKDRFSLVITADHGVCPIPEQKRYPTRYPGAERRTIAEVFKPLESALDETFGKDPSGPTRWLELSDKDAEQVWPWIFLNPATIQARKLDPVIVTDYATQWIGNRPFMLTAFNRQQLETGTLPPTTAANEKTIRAIMASVKLAYNRDRCGDIIAVPKAGVLVTPYDLGTSHGSPHDYDTHLPVLVFGSGVPALGKRTGGMSSLVVAPILARLLGIDPPSGAIVKPPAEIRGGK